MPSLIIDNGALNIRIGFQSNSKPSLMSYNRAIKMPFTPLLDQRKDYFCGNDIDVMATHLNVDGPIQNGRIVDWGLQFIIWSDLFDRLGIYSVNESSSKLEHQEHNLYVITSINYTHNCYNKIIDHVFSNYFVNKLSFGIDSLNAFYSKGLKTGVVIDSGDSLTSIIPVIQGHVDDKAIETSPLAGNYITQQIKRLLITNKNERICSQKHIDLIKNDCFHYSLDPASENNKVLYHLPDGTAVEIGKERHTLLESWFRDDGDGEINMAKSLWNNVIGFDRSVRVNMLSNVLFTGGNTMFPNLEKRFKYEFNKINDKIPIGIIENTNKLEASYTGSCLMTSLSSFENEVINKRDWEESGDALIYRKKTLVMR